MDEKKTPSISIEAKSDMRKGVYANLSRIVSTSKESVLDFCFIDEDDGINKHGVLVSRVIMSNQALVELRDMLDSHLANDFGHKETDDGD